jgi:mono/diheme cytochrome c family protein
MPRVQRAAGLAFLLSFIAGSAAFADAPSSDLVKRGEYLALAGDCLSCHTPKGSQLPSGGVQVQTPFGSIGAPNITPDRETGIGGWSDDDFYRVLHDGIGRNGSYIYPVMPFDHYTKVTREDVLAIKAYLFSLPPVHSAAATNHLSFPYNIREGLAAWRLVFFKPATFTPDLAQSAEENRGAYLVEGLGHCGACHTPRNLAMASEQSEALGGGEITGQGWFAPNISSDVREGIGAWRTGDIIDYLKTGVAPGHAVVAGPMAEVIHDSLRHLTDADLRAIAISLKAAPALELYAQQAAASPAGGNAYLTNCAFCHQPDGKGISGAVPPLAGNGVVLAGGPEDVIRAIQGGLPARGTYAAMPGLVELVPSNRIAEITNYVRSSFGNNAPPTATTGMVDGLAPTTLTMWSGTGPCVPLAPPLASVLGSTSADALLHQINAGNMVEQIDAILPKLHAADGTLAQADTVNGLTAAYCKIVMNDQSQPQISRLEQLQRFAMLVYSRLSPVP